MSIYGAAIAGLPSQSHAYGERTEAATSAFMSPEQREELEAAAHQPTEGEQTALATRLGQLTRRWWGHDDNAVNDLLWKMLGVDNPLDRLDILTRVGGMVEREREVVGCAVDDWDTLRRLVGLDYGDDFAAAVQVALEDCEADTLRECWAVVRECAATRAKVQR